MQITLFKMRMHLLNTCGVMADENDEVKELTFGDLAQEILKTMNILVKKVFVRLLLAKQSFCNPDENCVEELEMVLHYTCSPQKLRSDPVMRNSFLLWDKDLLD